MVVVIFAALPLVSLHGEHVVFDSLDSLLPGWVRRLQQALVDIACAGALAGLAGSFLVVGLKFQDGQTGGRGYIGLAAMIFGKWTPVGSLGAGLLFGFAESLSTNLSILRFPIPAELLLMVPYILTMVILAGVVGRSQGPAATGVPYEKESL